MFCNRSIRIAARASLLSRLQYEEMAQEFYAYHPQVKLFPIWMQTKGDLDKKTSLRALGNSNFFTQEIDEYLLQKKCDAALHSAKDLPHPLPAGLKVAAITQGVDERDALVFHPKQDLQELPLGAIIATSSLRREAMVRKLRKDFRFIDLRGTIEERLSYLPEKAQGIVVAEAALIRLKLVHLSRVYLEGEVAQGQGKLAIVVREEEEQMLALFAPLQGF